MRIGTNESFALRNGESITLRIDGIGPSDTMAVMAAPVPPLPSPQVDLTQDGKTVEQCAIVAAQLVDGRWQWMQLSPSTKEVVGDALFDTGLSRGEWHGLVVVTP